MLFGEVIEGIKKGKQYARNHWVSNGARIYLFVEENGMPIIAWDSKDHPRETYRAPSGDMLADDWSEVV